MDRYNDRPQLVGKVGFRGFAFCLFDGASAGVAQPYQVSSAHYFFDEREQGLLEALRHYMATLNRQQLGGNTTYLRRIKDIRPMQFFDAVCRVLAADDSHASLRLLYLWDGSDALPFPKAYDTRQEEDASEVQQQLPLLRPFALPLEDLPDFREVPLLGTALPLVLPKSSRVEQPAVGSWVKFRNLGARVVSGQLQAFFFRNSRWAPWQHEMQPQQQFMDEYRERLGANHTAGWAPDPRAGATELLTLCSHRERPCSTLRQVLLDTPAARPRCYRVLVRLVDHQPQDPTAMCHPASECGLPGPSNGIAGSSGWVYTLKLVVEDATATLDLILFGPDADCFFKDLPARDLRDEASAAAALRQRLQQLLGQGCQRDGGPWMELSIKSYYTDSTRPWQTRQYRVHDSSLQQLPAPA